MAIYAIGDIQGCYDELKQLLEKIQFKDDRDQLWFTGDLVNRGPKSLQTLRMIKAMDANVTAVLGNHDLHLLATAYDHLKPGKKDTLDEILDAPDREELLHWLRSRPLMHVDRKLDVVMLHAGLHPAWSIEQAQSLAHEVETVLQSDDHVSFYRHMYGDKPRNWSNKLNGWPRLRFITNIFTRLRYCDENGKSRLSAKGAPGTQPQGLRPWFEIDTRRSKDNRIIFGHWSTLALLKDYPYSNVYPLDTGCLWGGRLTALRIDETLYNRTSIACPETQKPKNNKQ
ncbi:MAG: symmetrical bis(5'-nucleosyl)-tetraphosphatase [Thiotrichales bacterium]|nr:MAG: symmetrical bis(5'-nucleosyl)-tetraphosphatase [Thiotrichales bacterium]